MAKVTLRERVQKYVEACPKFRIFSLGHAYEAGWHARGRADRLTKDCVVIPKKVAEFLRGAAPLDGVWFSEPHPQHTGKYWWRRHLRAKGRK